MPTTRSRSADDRKLSLLNDLASYRLEELFATLNIDLRPRGKLFMGCCPVHGGDNVSAINLYPDGHTVRGGWCCNTRHCHRHFHPTLIGFVHGVLSHQKCGWAADGDQMARFLEARDLLCNFLGKPWEKLEVVEAEAEKREFAARMSVFGVPPLVRRGWSRSLVRTRLVVPSPYFLSRGFSAEILDKYDVGDATDGPLANRAVVPVHDEAGVKVIGFTARNIHGECSLCGLHHAPTVPCEQACQYDAKWVNHKLDKADVLYNFWSAREPILLTRRVILVESPGNVWRCEEAGIHNVVGLLGSDLLDAQQVLLELSGAMHLICAFDDDAAGQECARQVTKQLGRSFRVTVVRPEANDWADMSVERVQSVLGCYT